MTTARISPSRRLALLPHQLRAFARNVLPNGISSNEVAYVALRPNGLPAPAWRPFAAFQILGGRRWSLSIIRTEDVTGYPVGKAPVDRALIEEALDLLDGEQTDPGEAATVLRRALAA